MIRPLAIAAVILLALASAAAAQFINWQAPMVPYRWGPGIDTPNSMTGPMVSNGNQIGGGVVPPPPTCTGAADFSDGCAVAVFGH